MKLVVGLGNPGDEYKYTRHNTGFLFLDYFAKQNNLSFKKGKLYHYLNYKQGMLIKPRTYMNRSGKAVLAAISKFDIDDILVIVDDIYLELGQLKVRKSGGSGGHNGLKSIIQVLGTKEFKRMRFGISNSDELSYSEYVLSEFSRLELKSLYRLFGNYIEIIKIYFTKTFDKVLDYYSKKNKTYSELIKTQDRSPKEEL